MLVHYDFSNAEKNPFASLLNENRTVTLDDKMPGYPLFKGSSERERKLYMNEAEYFEQSMARLEEIVKKLEGGSLTLAESIALYKEGAELSEKCRRAVNEARLAVKTAGEEAANAE